MTELKPKINKAKLIRELKIKADLDYYNSWEKKYAKQCYLQGVKDTIEKLKK